ncbi:ion channel [Tateyamaria sp.]|uniref:ion channel n=1 Tax=Tateyamaria sp. TaxID=1929288 RepID=UPI0039B981DD
MYATTVGYGDLRPPWLSSRTLAVMKAFVGLLLAGVFVGTGVHSVEMAVKAIP